uniref:Uncharacterized protein n=2 Tax=Picea TaxID=3328 RepID=A0A124GP50_PICGL|nr:hypothetical protein ABT39_MTgene714 [Picea glauca]QHR90207.1 hypothetical protein Q903MT_gene4230 [Picea sitchensis]
MSKLHSPFFFLCMMRHAKIRAAMRDGGRVDGCNVSSLVAPVCPVAGVQILFPALPRSLVLLECRLHLISIHG